MAVLTVQQIVETGLAPSFASAASGGDSFVNVAGKRTFLVVRNANESNPRTVTVTPSTGTLVLDGYGTVTKDPLVVSVPAEGERWIGPLPAPAFKEPAITYSDSAADLSVAVVKL